MSNTVLSNRQRELFEQKLEAGPNYPSELPPVVLAVIYWITALFHNLLDFVSSFLGEIHDTVTQLSDRVDGLESNVPGTSEVVVDASPSISPTTLPSATRHGQANTSTTTPPRSGHSKLRCRRCHARGHDTTECRTTNPDLVKKRVKNTEKTRKEEERRRRETLNPPIHPPIPYPFLHGDQYYHPPSTNTAMLALAADGREFRRRQVQSSRDRRRRGAATTTAR